jgi:beta-galactosidase
VDDAPVVSLTPHWTWPGREGQPVVVLVMSNAERVELRLNDRKVGEQAVDRIMGNEFSVPYAAGRIEVVAMRGGKVVATAAHETVGKPVALRLTPARTVMAGDDVDTQPVTIDAIDAAGRHVPTANLPTRFSVDGAAIIGVGNGDPNSHEPEKGNARSLFNGLAQVIVQAGTGRGRIVMTATAPGLKPARLVIDRAAIVPRAQVPATYGGQAIREWRRSPAFAARPDPSLAPIDGDNNSWAFVRSGTPVQAAAEGRWRLYRASVTPWRRIGAEGGTIRFASIAGKAELWVDGRRLASKAGAETGPLEAALPAGSGARQIVLVVEAAAEGVSGILGGVAMEPLAR